VRPRIIVRYKCALDGDDESRDDGDGCYLRGWRWRR
jgi:hypothetical protein